MPRGKSSFVCRECGYVSLGWLGRCPGCGSWNTIDEAAPQVSAFPRNDALILEDRDPHDTLRDAIVLMIRRLSFHYDQVPVGSRLSKTEQLRLGHRARFIADLARDRKVSGDNDIVGLRIRLMDIERSTKAIGSHDTRAIVDVQKEFDLLLPWATAREEGSSRMLAKLGEE